MKSYSTLEAAAFCHVDRRTVLRWVESGALPSWTTAGGRHRIPGDALVAFLRAHGVAVPVELVPAPPVDLVAVVYGPHEGLVRAAFPEAAVTPEADGFDLGLQLGRAPPHVLVVDGARSDAAAVVRRVSADPLLSQVRIVVVGGPSEGLPADARLADPADVAGLRAAVRPKG